jgi:triosephosphate isomerase
MRRLVAGTGWKMNNGIADSIRYAEELKTRIAAFDVSAIDIYVLPPFTSLAAAAKVFAGSPVAVGGQNMHWEDSGSWTGEISAPMLLEAGCRYVELAHSERLWHFGETYAQVRRKVGKALDAGLIPIVCLGETAQEKADGRADQALSEQLRVSIEGLPARRVPQIVFAYEPRWAIGAAEAAPPAHIEARHRVLRAALREQCGEEAAERTRIIYGGSVTPENGRAILGLEDVDGLFVGRAAWKPEGFARIVELVNDAAKRKVAG